MKEFWRGFKKGKKQKNKGREESRERMKEGKKEGNYPWILVAILRLSAIFIKLEQKKKVHHSLLWNIPTTDWFK